MPDILIHDYCKKDFEDLLELARYGANNAMIGVNMKWEELPPHGDLIDLQAMLSESENGKYVWAYDLTDLPEFTKDLPVVIPAEK